MDPGSDLQTHDIPRSPGIMYSKPVPWSIHIMDLGAGLLCTIGSPRGRDPIMDLPGCPYVQDHRTSSLSSRGTSSGDLEVSGLEYHGISWFRTLDPWIQRSNHQISEVLVMDPEGSHAQRGTMHLRYWSTGQSPKPSKVLVPSYLRQVRR